MNTVFRYFVTQLWLDNECRQISHVKEHKRQVLVHSAASSLKKPTNQNGQDNTKPNIRLIMHLQMDQLLA